MIMHFLARITHSRQGGEDVFSAVVLMGCRRVFAAGELPTLQAARCEVLDWANRNGKRELLAWDYVINRKGRKDHKFEI